MSIDPITLYILEQSITKGKFKVLNHLTFAEHINSIKKKGLIPRKKYSMYGNPPLLDAIYLYIKGSDTVNKFKKTFKDKKIVNIKIDATKLDPNLFIADEDFYRYPRKRELPSEEKMKTDVIKSLNLLGTVAYKGVIPPKYFLEIKKV